MELGKPPYLYHASASRDITSFEPRSGSVRDSSEASRVFATPDKRLATVFLVSTDDSWANSGLFNGVPYLIVGDENRFRQADKGGAIYSLPNDTFSSDPNKGLGDYEWTSDKEVLPISNEEYDSALEAMLESGVQVYFTDMETYQAFQNAEDHGLSILRNLMSENKKRDINLVEI